MSATRALFPRLFTRQKFAERRALLTPMLQKLCGAFCALSGEAAPLFVIDSHPVHICKLVRVRGKERLQGLAACLPARQATGCCAALKPYFHGVREHLIITPEGRPASLLELPGNRHDDINGAYALLKTA